MEGEFGEVLIDRGFIYISSKCAFGFALPK
jgi:hypothetical protein